MHGTASRYSLVNSEDTDDVFKELREAKLSSFLNHGDDVCKHLFLFGPIIL